MSEGPEAPFLDTVEGEISFYRSVMRARPVGIHNQFHILTIRNAILKDTGHSVSTEQIWEKLRSLYDLEALEGLEPDGYESAESDDSTPAVIRSPSPSENLSNHPHFHSEYSLPVDESFEALIAPRRIRVTASPPSSPYASSPIRIPRGTRSKKGPSKADMAGLVGGDSDSSALTQESGDEGDAPNVRESVATGTEGGTDAEQEGDETREESAGPSTPPKAPRKPRNEAAKVQKIPKTRTAAAASSVARTVKRRKR